MTLKMILTAFMTCTLTISSSSCAHKTKVPIPPGYTNNGICIPEGIDKNGDPTIIRCKQNDGKTFVYRR